MFVLELSPDLLAVWSTVNSVHATYMYEVDIRWLYMNNEGFENLIFLGSRFQKLLTVIFSDRIETETIYETNCPVIQATSSLIQDTIVFNSQIIGWHRRTATVICLILIFTARTNISII